MSNFHLVSDVNAVAGNVVSRTWATVQRQFKIIEREFLELKGHVDEQDGGRYLEKLRDDVCDLLVTTYGMGYLLGIDVDADMVVATQALMSRFDRTPEDQSRTELKYNDLAVPTICRRVEHTDGNVYYVTVCAMDCVGTDGEKYIKGKWLKSYQFHEPVYSSIDFTLS